MERVVIAGTPKPLPERFERARWPLHVTVVPNFTVDGPAAAAVVSIVSEAAASSPTFTVDLGPPRLFGPAHDIPVLLAEHPLFHSLHTNIAEEVSKLPGFRPDFSEFWGPGYRPHATNTSRLRLPPFRQTTISNLAVAALGHAEARTLMNRRLTVDGAVA